MEVELKEELIGEWIEELCGTDLLYLQPVTDRSRLRINLHADGTAFWGYIQPNESTTEETQAPFPETWEVSADRILSIWVPIPPNPDPNYEMPDWSREQVCYDILAVSSISLALSNRRFDGEFVIILRRRSRPQSPAPTT
jgi:hypothetical protein